MTKLKERNLITLAQGMAEKFSLDPSVKIGIGDDCALVLPKADKGLIITTDSMAEGTHFDLSYFTPFELGVKSASVNLSDIAAMGGVPKWALLCLSLPFSISEDFVNAFLKGLINKLAYAGATLVGGDTISSTGPLNVTVTIIGETDLDNFLSRDMAKPGELIFCSGYLGQAALGLEWLKKHGRTYGSGCKHSLKRLFLRHLMPEPRIELGKALAKSGLARCAIDVSDGPATDLAHICKKSGVKAILNKAALPISRASKKVASALNINPLEPALRGGEDFELIWTAKPSKLQEISKIAAKLNLNAFVIGKVEEGSGVWLRQESGHQIEISYQGYEHQL